MFPRRPPPLLLALSLAAVVVAGCSPLRPGGAAGRYQFCFWNVENLFDDQNDPSDQPADKQFDDWFARNRAARQEKYEHLSEALLGLNGGRGPDVLAVVEVESVRAAELLRDALNARLADPSLHYQHVLMKDLDAGRHIAPAVITRLPVRAGKTRLHGSRLRILETHIDVNGHDLVLVVSHWTSRLTDKEGDRRDKYADQVYGLFRAMYHATPAVDFLACGDFNASPDEPSVAEHLHATADQRAVAEELFSPRPEPVLLDLLADKDPREFGTHYYRKWLIFDHVVISPGLLDNQGWGCDPDSVRVVNSLHRPGDRLRRPWRFGNPRDRGPRGYSDHFPVTVQLRVNAAG